MMEKNEGGVGSGSITRWSQFIPARNLSMSLAEEWGQIRNELRFSSLVPGRRTPFRKGLLPNGTSMAHDKSIKR